MTIDRAVRLHGYGGPEVTTLDEIAVPDPGPAQVLVRVAAAGMNPFDRKLRMGALRDQFPLELPVTLPGSVTAFPIQMHPDVRQLAELADRVASGEIRVAVGRTVAFDDAVEAIEQLGTSTTGKTVMVVS